MGIKKAFKKSKIYRPLRKFLNANYNNVCKITILFGTFDKSIFVTSEKQERGQARHAFPKTAKY
jgi:hypothetical protein